VGLLTEKFESDQSRGNDSQTDVHEPDLLQFHPPSQAAQTIPEFAMIDRNQETFPVTAKWQKSGRLGRFSTFHQAARCGLANIRSQSY
jgi:hypothetical protein